MPKRLRYWDGSQWLDPSVAGVMTPIRPVDDPSLPGGNPLGVVGLVGAIIGAVFGMLAGRLHRGLDSPTNCVDPVDHRLAFPRKHKGAATAALIIAIVGTIAGFVVFFASLSTAFDSGFTQGFSGGPDSEDASSSQEVDLPAGFKDTEQGIAIRWVSAPECPAITSCSYWK